jgi:radical SAM protein with 4Fe4S-binding SPASM domain
MLITVEGKDIGDAGPPHQAGCFEQLADWLFVRKQGSRYLLIRSFPFNVLELSSEELTAVRAYLAGEQPLAGSLAELLAQHHFLDGEPDPEDYLNRHVSAILLVTTACNLACSGCFASGGDYGLGRRHITPEVVDATVAYLARQLERLYADGHPGKTNFGLHFFGGEPFIVFDRMQYAVEKAREAAAVLSRKVGRTIPTDFYVTTNGTLLDAGRINFLKEHDFTVLVSIDGPDHDERRAYASGRGSLAKAITAFRDLRIAGIRTRLNTVVLDKDVGDFGTILQWFKSEIYRDEPSLSIYHTFSFQREGPGLPVGLCGNTYPHHLMEKYISELRDFNSAGYQIYEVGLRKKLQTGGTFYKCSSGVKRIAVDPTGRVYPCQGFVDAQMDMGSILNPEFDHWQTPCSQKLARRNIATLKPCRDCVFSALCPHNVDCAARAHYTLGGIMEIDVNGMCRVGYELMDRILFDSDFAWAAAHPGRTSSPLAEP